MTRTEELRTRLALPLKTLGLSIVDANGVILAGTENAAVAEAVVAAVNEGARLRQTVADVARRIAAQAKASDAYAASAVTRHEARPTVWELQNGHFRDLGDELTRALEGASR